jgi:hypothetical protein
VFVFFWQKTNGMKTGEIDFWLPTEDLYKRFCDVIGALPFAEIALAT